MRYLNALIFMAMTGWLGACSDASFNAASGIRKEGNDKKKCKVPPCDETQEFDENNPNNIKVRYGKDVKPSVSDILFVLDNSVSMKSHAQRVISALSGISQDTFPDSTKLAVMTTMAAVDPNALSLRAHDDIWRHRSHTANGKTWNYESCINKEPGFLSFVDKQSVEAFKTCPGLPDDYAARYSKPACESGWFKPFDVNENGDRCFTAALQNSFHPTGCEPGLLALEQLLKRNERKPLFRDNAALSIIFISDEQQGCSAASTQKNPNHPQGVANDLKRAIFNNTKTIKSLKVHGIIPFTGVPGNTLSYRPVVETLGGKAFDVLAANSNYNSMIEQLITDKIDNTTPEFFIPATAKKVTSVEIDGVVTNDYRFDSAISKVTIEGLDPEKTVDIVIRFE
jgi:hypothetical protein